MTVSLSSVHRPESNEAVRDELRLEIKKHNKGIVPQRGNRRRQQCRGSRADTSSVAVAHYRIQMIQRQRPRTPSWNAASTPLFLGLHWLQTKHGGSDGRKKWGGEAESTKGNTWPLDVYIGGCRTFNSCSRYFWVGWFIWIYCWIFATMFSGSWQGIPSSLQGFLSFSCKSSACQQVITKITSIVCELHS